MERLHQRNPDGRRAASDSVEAGEREGQGGVRSSLQEVAVPAEHGEEEAGRACRPPHAP